MEVAKKKFGKFMYRLFDVAGSKTRADERKKAAARMFQHARIAKVEMPSGIVVYGVWVR